MKSKNSFTTNSSSASYIVIVPDSITLSKMSDKEILKYLDEYDIEYETGVDEIRERLLEIDDKKALYSYDNRGYNTVVNILQNMNLVVCQISSGPDDSMITVLDNDKVRKVLGVNK